VPAYAGTERRVVLIDTSHSFYVQDLVQNDAWLTLGRTAWWTSARLVLTVRLPRADLDLRRRCGLKTRRLKNRHRKVFSGVFN
jgi:hypothetical protein